jgi:hypothetical protein
MGVELTSFRNVPRSQLTPNGPNSARAAVLACGISQQLTEENMRTLRMAFVGGFAGASMAGNVATLHAAPLPTNVASMKSSRQFDPGPVGRRAAAGISVRRVLKEVGRHGTR